MKMIGIEIMIIACLVGCTSCEKEEFSYVDGDLKIEIEAGEHWLHDFLLFLGISKKNPPQFAIWIEYMEGNYLSTLFVTNKIATEGWLANNGNRRKEALPHWCHQRGVIYKDGLMLPTLDQPFIDGISGATPKDSHTAQLILDGFNEPIVIKTEFNHSLDFNDFLPVYGLIGGYTRYFGKAQRHSLLINLEYQYGERNYIQEYKASDISIASIGNFKLSPIHFSIGYGFNF